MIKKAIRTFNLNTLALFLIAVVLLISSSTYFLINGQKYRTISKYNSSDIVDVDYNNTFSSQKHIQITEKVNFNNFGYSFCKKEDGQKLFNLNFDKKINLYDIPSTHNGLNATAVGIGAAVVAGGPAGAAAAIGGAAKAGQLIAGAAWLTKGSLSAASTLQLVGAAALTANPVGTALIVVGAA